MTNAKTKFSVTKMVQLGVLTAIILLMSFTPLGYLRTGTVEITLIGIPVAVGAIVLGAKSGAFLGTVFGLTSFIQCFGISAFGTALCQINPFLTFILCLVPRILCGILPAFIFKALSKFDKTKLISYAVASLSTALINTIFFVGGLLLFFWKTDFIQGLNSDGKNVMAFMIAFIGINGLIEAIATLFAGGAIAKAVDKFVNKI